MRTETVLVENLVQGAFRVATLGPMITADAVVIGAIAEQRPRVYDRRMHWFASLVVRSGAVRS